MKRLIYILICFLLQSCAYKPVPLKGTYQDGAVKSKIDLPFEKTWEKVIDMIASTGVSVKMIDKSSGLIIGESGSFWQLVTIEDKKGKIVDPELFIVRERMPTELRPLPVNATATWNLRVKPLDNASSVISVKLHTIKIEKSTSALQFKGLSTGNFEKWMIDEIVKDDN